MEQEHSYQLTVQWTGNTGQGTKDYRSYERSHTISAAGKSDLLSSSDPSFKGDPSCWNPEELLLASLSSCQMLWYLHLASTRKIIVTQYSDQPQAIMVIEPTGKGYFKEATLNPRVVITDPSRIEEANSLHEEAHKKCFIANSINFPVKIVPAIQ